MALEIKQGSDFSIYNIPFGIFSTSELSPRVGVAVGDYILDVLELSRQDLLDCDENVLDNTYLNDFIKLGKSVSSKVRKDIQELLQRKNSILTKKSHFFISQNEAKMHMPVKVGDYTDFYSSIEHATNVGKLFRDPEKALLPNWKHLPVGYHGRASSIVVSGTDIHRPSGQIKPGDNPPVFKPSTRLDFESPWVVTLDALKPFSVPGPQQNPKVLNYLTYKGNKNYDINLEVLIKPEGGQEEVICHSNYKYMYWNMVQQLAHHTSNGCNVNVGDMMASGTISGKDEKSHGCLLEMSHGGKQSIQLKDGQQRTFIEDGDTIIMNGFAQKGEIRVGFGEVSGKVLPNKLV